MAPPTPPTLTTVGRQKVIDYVTKDYEGFRQAMLNQIPLRLPQWTDRGESDFGVVLIELFAYVADILSYYQDRVANEAYLDTATQRRSVTELLRLIDYQIDPGLAASAYLHFDVTADVTVKDDAIPYRLRTAGRPGESDAVFEVTKLFALKLLNNAIPLSAQPALAAGTSAVRLDMASHALSEGDVVYLEEKQSLPDGTTKVRRSEPLRVARIQPVSADQHEVLWLPPLSESFSPADTTLKGNNVLATQGETINDEPLFVSDGTPGQRFTLSRKPVTHLLSNEPFRRRRSRPELEVLVDGQRWDDVESFFGSGPSDRHYVTTIDDADITTVTFGTGTRGAVPPAGSQVQARYRVGLGSGGNVGSDALSVPVTTVPGVKALNNPFAATGGADRESTEEAKISGPGSIIAQERAVTLRDYELLAEGFGGVGKARARVGLRGGYKVVQLYVAPENPQTVPPPPPSSELREKLQRFLEARMPVNRMAGVEVLAPRYIPVDITVEVHLKAEASPTRVRDEVSQVLRDLLSFAQQDFGKGVRVGEVYSALYPIQGVSYALLGRLRRQDQPATAKDCEFADVRMSENEMACLGLLTVNVIGGA
ncbi:putative baseplate assembly protein [Myxococcus stipitatus]|uniref:putative baseplate assembly protein n=1 Tax=Myxococcus stipitatus TaxID=83455 RepID=UPI001F245916|nr:putative baseplate assembly protein [Myxococcus stipitatus]MCE9672841.1 putative baseplate assembly protein [Myxococcus stipitatus]